MPFYRDKNARLRPLMVPMIVLAVVIGLNYLFLDDQRFSTPSFHAQREIAAMHIWGAMFLVGAGGMTTAMVLRNLKWMHRSLFLGGVIYTWWAFLFLMSVLRDPHANPNGFALYLFVALFHFLGAAPYLLDRLLYGKKVG